MTWKRFHILSVRDDARRKRFCRLFEPLATRGFGFDVELLLLARAAGCRIVEVPVTWADQPESKVGVLRHGPGMLWQIVRARLRIGRHR